MEFRVLGPLEVIDGERAVPLRGAKQRALLAALLIRANEVVAEDVLLDELWPDAPSGNAALRVRISQLRRSLGPVADRLVTRPPGYALEVADDEVDARRFERLLAAGRAAIRSGDPAHAVEVLRGALASWRGVPYADVAYERFALAEIARLEELKSVASEELMDAELSLGRHAEVAAELEALVLEHPLRERLRAQLMVALYRSGRQTDALAVYGAGRAALVEQLGLEPGAALQKLERAILRQDAALDLPGGAALPGRTPAADERKLVTVLVARVGDGARGDAEEEILRAGGRIESVAGGAITAAFGVPVALEDHAVRALDAALAIRARCGSTVSVGVETGEVVVTQASRGVGGAAVSTAAGLAGRRAGATLVGPRTHAAARGRFELGDADEDGSRPLLGAIEPADLGRAAPRTPLVGRRRELAALEEAHRRAAGERRPVLVTVAGDAGVGKSRLLHELCDRLDESVRCHFVRCVPGGGAYRPLAELLRREFGIADGASKDEVLERLRDDRILGLTLGVDAAPELHPLGARQQLEDRWVELLFRLASSTTLVVFAEDVHWAEDALLDLLERAHGEVDAGVLVVATARPELFDSRPSWGRHAAATTIWLEPLVRDEADELLRAVDDAMPPAVRDAVLARAEGNPFFLEELAQAVGDTGGVPDSVHAVLSARIDLLPVHDKAALQAAAVVGRAFGERAVASLVRRPSVDLTLLEARDFVRRRSVASEQAGREYSFKHALTWEVAYAGMTAATRARLHAACGDWIQRAGGGRDEDAAALAHHYAEALRSDDGGPELERLRSHACRWSIRAAELATGRYEVDEAVALLERALELEPDAPTRLLALRRLARAHAVRHDGDAFLDAVTSAIALSADRETTAELYADLVFETALRTGMWRRRPDRELVDGWIAHALELAGPGTATRAKALIARCVWAPGEALAEGAEAVEIADRLGEPELRSYAWDARGITLWVAGEHEQGRDYESRRFELLDQIHDPDHTGDIYYAPITGYVWFGQFDVARRLALRHDEIVGRLTPHHRIHGLAALTELEELTGRWEAIRGLSERIPDIVLANRDTPCMRSPRILLVAAIAEHRIGSAARARELEQLADEFGYEGFGHTLETPKLRLALLRGDLEAAADIVARPLPDRGWHRAWLLLSTQAARLDALATLRWRDEVEAWPEVRAGTYLEPFRLRALACVREDEALLESAAVAFERLGLPVFADETRELVVGGGR